MKRLVLVFSALMALAACSQSPSVKLAAPTPPLGWNSYNCFGGNATEADIKANADYMAEHLKDYGWQYVVVDFLWYCDDQSAPEKFLNRRPEQHIDEFGRLVPSPVIHPSSEGGKGFGPLAEYVHSKGLKFGIHIMRGMPWQAVAQNTPVKGTSHRASEIANPTDTCRWYGGLMGVNMAQPGAQEYYNSLFELYASWGVDYVKVDDASFPYHADEIEAVSKAIRNCGREMVFSLSPGPAPTGNIKHLREHADMWRISADFWDTWHQLEEQLELCREWAPLVAEGHWPDADMLPIGHLQVRSEVAGSYDHYTRFSHDEQIFMMTLWAIFRSPLMIGANLPDNDEFTLSLLTNADVLRVNQHSKGGREVCFDSGVSVWEAEDQEEQGVLYRAYLNTNDSASPVSITADGAAVKNLWTGEAVGDGEVVEIPAHGALMLSITK